MRKSLCSLLLLGGLTLSGSPAFGQPQIAGNVYQVVPQGVYIQNSNGISFVPQASASFRVGNTAINLSALHVGSPINAYSQTYRPQYVPIEYYQQHPDWDWNRHVNGWQQDRKYWKHDNGRWHNEGNYERRYDDRGHGKKHKEHRDNGNHGKGHRGHDDD